MLFTAKALTGASKPEKKLPKKQSCGISCPSQIKKGYISGVVEIHKPTRTLGKGPPTTTPGFPNPVSLTYLIARTGPPTLA